MITVTTKAEAWDIAMALLGGKMSYILDQKSSERAGYNIFRNDESYYSYICDLGDRLKVNMENGATKNIWIGNLTDKQKESTKEIIHKCDCSSDIFFDKVADKVADKLLKSLQK